MKRKTNEKTTYKQKVFGSDYILIFRFSYFIYNIYVGKWLDEIDWIVDGLTVHIDATSTMQWSTEIP